MEQEKSLALIEGVDALTKTNQKAIADELITKVVGGEVDPIKAFIQIKGIVECLNTFLKDKGVVDTTVDACSRYGDERPSYAGAKMCVAEVGVRYDYSVCGDPKWNELAAAKASIEAQLKAREDFLKHIDGEQTIVDAESGEVVTVIAPVKTSSTSVKVTFGK